MSRVPSARQYEQTVQDREYGPPPPAARIYTTGASGGIVVIAILLFSLVVMYLVSRNGTSAWVGIVGTTIFFTVAVPIGLMASNGSFAIMHGTWQEQRTLRVLHQQRISVPDLPQLDYTPPVAPALPAASTFVSPVAEVEESARREAGAWVLQLYGGDGQPDPDKVLVETDKERPGRIKISRPSKPATQWLLDIGILHSLGNGYRLNLSRCPTIREAQARMALPPAPGGYPTHHHLPTEGGTYGR